MIVEYRDGAPTVAPRYLAVPVLVVGPPSLAVALEVPLPRLEFGDHVLVIEAISAVLDDHQEDPVLPHEGLTFHRTPSVLDGVSQSSVKGTVDVLNAVPLDQLGQFDMADGFPLLLALEDETDPVDNFQLLENFFPIEPLEHYNHSFLKVGLGIFYPLWYNGRLVSEEI